MPATRGSVVTLLRVMTLVPVSAAICRAAPVLQYQLGFERWNTHLLDVTVRATDLAGPAARFALPIWSPGSYVVRNFATEVQGFRANDAAGHSLPWHKTDAQTWQVDLGSVHEVIVHYQVYANSLGRAQYDDRHVAINGPAVWMYQVDGKDRPIALTIDTAQLPSDWHIATGLGKTGATAFHATDYDWFADCPIEIAPFTQKDISVLGTTYHFIVHDVQGKQDYTRFTQDIQHILEKGLVPILAPAVGGPLAAPFPEYWFIIHVDSGSGQGGGTEHLNSTKITFGRDWGDSSATTHDYVTNQYDLKLLIAVHELFHAWNVKRLRPRPLGPFDYTHTVHTPSLWISEGLTSYFTCVALLRSGYWTPDQYLGYVSRLITGLDAMPGRSERSIAETSWDTWFGYIGGDSFDPRNVGTNILNTNYSYYDGGQTLGVLLDLEIRHQTNGRRSLDDWMRAMYTGYALPKPGFEQADVERIAAQVAGTDMSEFFRRYLFGKDPLPYDRDFSYAGITVQRATPAAGWSGVVLATTRDGKSAVSNIIPGSPAERDGLDRGDIVTAVDQQAVDPTELPRTLASRHPGDRVVFTVLHHGVSRDVPVTFTADPHPTYTLVPAPTPSSAQAAVYRQVLNVK